MAKFGTQFYIDFFGFNKKLFEDDWNDDQKYVVKLKQKGEEIDLAHTIKVGETKSDSQKVSMETKINIDTKAWQGFHNEVKIKNSGEMLVDAKSDVLKQFEGFENVQLQAKTTHNKNATPISLGFNYDTDTLNYQQLVETTGDNAMEIKMTYKAADWLTIGGNKKWASVTDPMANILWKAGAKGNFEKKLQYGMLVNGSAATLSDVSITDANCYFNHESGNKTVGAEMNYSNADKKWACQLGMNLKQDDHTWKFRLLDSGVARVALQWQLHKVCKTTVNTKVDVKQALNGSVTSLPLGVTFDMKY